MYVIPLVSSFAIELSVYKINEFVMAQLGNNNQNEYIKKIDIFAKHL